MKAFRVDFMSMLVPKRKAKFRQFQLLALSKGIIWGSGRTTPYPITRLKQFLPGMASICPGYDRSNPWSMFSSSCKDYPVIDIKEALQLLKEYKPDEARKIDQRTIQSIDATATTASYIVPSSISGATIGVD